MTRKVSLETIMKYLLLLTILISGQAMANYAVGRSIQDDGKCGVFLYTGLAERVQGHPITRMPKILQILENDQRVNFRYKNWHRSYDSIITTFESDNGDVVLHDDACFTSYPSGMRLTNCFRYQGCEYSANAL